MVNGALQKYRGGQNGILVYNIFFNTNERTIKYDIFLLYPQQIVCKYCYSKNTDSRLF